eukprot:Tamp_21906.p2 GENE.Tamp_21906~~Tamp_21906.p2  ORF type:complete len:141 (+),score=21.54 Tamp_21906:30-452(+)
MRAAGRGGACACLLVLASARLVPTAAWAARGLHLASGKASRQPRVEGAMNSAAQADQRCQLALPPVVLGTFQLKGDLVKGIVRAGLDQGARAIDTASVYRNEVQIGEAIKESGIPRSDLFITSKLGPSEQVHTRAHTHAR